MNRIFFADKDTYVTNKVISNEEMVSSSLGQAGTIDLFKIFGNSFKTVGGQKIPNIELSRGLIHFDISELKSVFNDQQVDISDPSFNCELMLHDVYGGQTTPNNFSLVIQPLSRSFSEGLGSDVVYYTDYDVANYISSSNRESWSQPGASHGDILGTNCDFFELPELNSEQLFKTGEEDLNVDVTKIISGVLVGQIPDEGFRISFKRSQEEDEYTYFVKRFASRHSYDHSLQPQLRVRFNDSIQDDRLNLTFDTHKNVFFYNIEDGELKNFFSGSTEIVGQECLKLTLENSKISNIGSLTFTGSQYSAGNVSKRGIYYSTINISETPFIKNYVEKSGSLELLPVWKSLDERMIFGTGEPLQFFKKRIYGTQVPINQYVVNVKNIPDVLKFDETTVARVNIFEVMNPEVKLQKVPVENRCVIVKNSHFQIRDVNSSKVIIPFDQKFNSTLLSSDDKGMYFLIDKKSLIPGKSYVVDIQLILGNSSIVYKDVSNIFKLVN